MKAWNVAGEFVRPKNMTIGSNSTRLVRNAAFHSSSIEDDVVEPTQCQTYQSESHKSKNVSPSSKERPFNEQNKENQNKSNENVNQKSPTVLSKNAKKNEVNIV